MPVMMTVDSDAVVLNDAEVATLLPLLAIDRTVLSKVLRIARINGTIYVRGNTNGWWRFKPTAPVWTACADPTVPPPPVFAPPDIMDLDLTSEAEVRSWINIMSGNEGANQISANRAGEWLTDPSNGMHYLRAGGDPANSMRILNWFAQFGQAGTKLANVPLMDEVYCRSCYYIEPDFLTGVDRRSLGLKLSGMSMTYPGLWPAAIGELDVTELPGNVTDAPFRGYGYWQEGQQMLQPTNDRPPYGKWFCIEEHVRMNTLGQRDGVLEYWRDDVPTYSRTDVDFRGNNAAAKWGCMQVQLYAGGATYLFTGPVHVRLARVAISTKRIGMPQELRSA